MDTEQEHDSPGEAPTHTRRRVLAGAALGGAAVVGGAAGAGAATATNGGVGWVRETLEFDVACLGDTYRRAITKNPADDADGREAFHVEGWMYPAGTVPHQFVPIEEGNIGRWFCSGWVIVNPDRLQPHACTTQNYVFGQISSSSVFPPDVITSSGLEGANSIEPIANRPVSGGTGTYLGVTGVCRQQIIGLNTTVVDNGSGGNAPNFSFKFDLIRPDI